LTENLQVELREALYDFQRYLLDQIPPLTAGDAIETLMRQPAELFVRHTHAWAVEQSRVQPMAISDFMFHALKKVYLCSTLSVLDPAAVDEFLTRAVPLALQICPADERDILLSHLNAMRSSQSLRVAPVNLNALKDTASGKEPAPSTEVPKDSLVARSARRFSLVVDRLARMLPGTAPSTSGDVQGQPLQPAAPTAEMVTMAAASSTSSRELESYLETLRPYTGDSQENLFRILARGIPGWELMPTGDAGPAPAAPLEAMHKIMKLTDDSLESTRRFRELLNAGIERFNAGSLGAAVSIFELAETVIEEKKLDPSTIDRIRVDLAETISPEQLKQYGEHKAKYPLLRKALAFFPPLQLENLLQELRVEERPERRRSILGLLEAYGPQAREAAVAELPVELDRPVEEIAPYYLRNLIYLMHRIPRSEEAPVEAEIDLLARASTRGQSIYVIKEAMLPLGQIRSEAAVKLLTMRLAEAEATLLRSDTSLYPVDEMHKLVDRIISVLGRIGTPAALLTIARHGMKPNPLLGDTRSRLAALSQHDLSFDEQTVTLLVKTIREDLSGNLLGRLLRMRQAPPLRLIEALSSTRSHLVESLFEEIAARFPDDDAGKAATAALENLAAAAKRETTTEGVAALTGDLQFFGLPALLQSLRDTQATGIVTLSGKEAGNTAGKLLLLEGDFLDAQAAHLRGVDALYQLLERPVVGSFTFVSQPPAKVKTSRNTPKDLMPLIFEGIRRHDELKQASALAPDDLVTRPTAVKPTAASDEIDASIVRDVWVKATSGKPIHEWEPQVLVDAYRIRRQIAHWLEEGSLQPVEE
jgi:hypothetical protein